MAISIKRRLETHFYAFVGKLCHTISHENINRLLHMADANTLGNVTDSHRPFMSLSLGLYKAVFKKKEIYDEMSWMVLKGPLLRFIKMFPTFGFPINPSNVLLTSFLLSQWT